MRPSVFQSVLAQLRFQSTHPHGVRRSLRGKHTEVNKFQSTHPHGVRLFGGKIVLEVGEFQSTHPHGVRHNKGVELYAPNEFQSTHPHGVRLQLNLIISTCLSFNPRTHTGCDLYECLSWIMRIVSIHAPTRGATRPLVRYSVSHSFQSTHPHGVRPTCAT